MRIVSLASGSKGNATIIEEDGVALLIDCGLSGREFVRRCRSVGIDLEKIVVALFTHNHQDHTSGIDALRKYCPLAEFYANFMTAEAIAVECKIKETDFRCFENGQTFEIGPFAISPFSIPHDTPDPVGFLVKGSLVYFHGTDIGSPLDSIGLKLAEADVATLESNHDPVLLHNSGRPPHLIQRIFGSRGHLSNDQSAELVKKFASRRLKTLALGHISSACNEPHLVAAVMRSALNEMNRSEVELKILLQNEAVEVWNG